MPAPRTYIAIAPYYWGEGSTVAAALISLLRVGCCEGPIRVMQMPEGATEVHVSQMGDLGWTAGEAGGHPRKVPAARQASEGRVAIETPMYTFAGDQLEGAMGDAAAYFSEMNESTEPMERARLAVSAAESLLAIAAYLASTAEESN